MKPNAKSRQPGWKHAVAITLLVVFIATIFFLHWLAERETYDPPYVAEEVQPETPTPPVAEDFGPVLLWCLSDHPDEIDIPRRGDGDAALMLMSDRVIYNHGDHTLNLTDGVLRTVGRSAQWLGFFINLAALELNPYDNEYIVIIEGYLDGPRGNFRIRGMSPVQEFPGGLHNHVVNDDDGSFAVQLIIPSPAVYNWAGNILRIESNMATANAQIVIETIRIYRYSTA